MMPFPALPPRPRPLQFESIAFQALEEGPALIVLGAVHGNEVCGTLALLKLIEDLRSGQLKLLKGRVTLVPITNPLAYNRQQRNGDRNLNRNLTPTSSPVDFEDHVANWLCPLLAEHDVLLDLHSFQKGNRPFALFGPPDNQTELQPFSQARPERDLAFRLGVDRFLDGWLETYAEGVSRRVRTAVEKGRNLQGLNTDSRYGMGTTEWMRATGGYAVTLECGQHEEESAPATAYNAILRTLVHLGLVEGEPIAPVKAFQHLSLVQVVDKENAEDAFVQAWSSFDAVKKGQPIGVRADGSSVLAERDAWIVFPNTAAQAGQEWFYLATQNKN